MCQARSQKFAMGGRVFWGSGGKAPSRRRHRGLGAEPPALANFAFFCKYNLILAILIKTNAFKTWHRNYQRNMIQLVALSGYVGNG